MLYYIYPSRVRACGAPSGVHPTGHVVDTRTAAAQVDQQQIAALCAQLRARRASMRVEQALLEQLITHTAPIRPFQARKYQRLLDELRVRSRTLDSLLARYCPQP